MKLQVLALIGAAGSMTAAMAQPTEPMEVERTETLTATVESINLGERMIELKTDEGTQTVQVPPEVRNLDQIEPGDEVVVEYYEAIAAQFRKPGEGPPAGVVDARSGAARNPQGARPGGAVANSVTTTVVIDAVDQPSNSVTFTGPSGMTRTVDVKDPEAQEFISTLKKGDRVELTYTEALAVTVQPQDKGP